MKTLWAILLTLALWATTSSAVTVNGVATLSGQQNHSGIKVLFREVSPSAQTDSTFTNAWGVFLISLQPGVYDVEYSREDFALYLLPNQILLFNTTLDPVMLMPPLSGYLSGTLGPGDFQVTDSIVVAANASLTIQAGTRLWFDGMHRFIVRGLLTAVGTEQDSIVFTRRRNSGLDTLWSGLTIVNANDQTELSYVIVEYVRGDEDYPSFYEGAGLYCVGTDISLSHSTIRFNHSASSGAGAWFDASSPSVEECIFYRNTSDFSVGAAYFRDSEPIFENCTFESNYGAAIYGYHGNVSIRNCLFLSNTVSIRLIGGSSEVVECRAQQSHGTVIDLFGVTNTSVRRCVFLSNTTYNSGIVSLASSEALFTSCVIMDPVASGLLMSFEESSESEIRFCDFFAPDGGEFLFPNDDPSHGPPAIGLIALSNANGDSCDTYYNIFADPQFADTANGDYHLLASSPCIDAGDPDLPLDPDGTVADIGAYYFNQSGTRDPFIPHPSSLVLSAYPNPFNAVTTISFTLPQFGDAEVSIFDVTGRFVKTLAEHNLAPGEHHLRFDAGELPSGVYFARLQTAARAMTHKLLLVR